jgi:hypothetical protein
MLHLHGGDGSYLGGDALPTEYVVSQETNSEAIIKKQTSKAPNKQLVNTNMKREVPFCIVS